MAKNLVIVESPAKAKTIEGFLGKDYVVKSSYGHVRDLAKKGMSVDVDSDFEPDYEILEDKKKVINDLKKELKKAEMVWLATDEDREGEAISWHLCHALDLNPDDTKRIVFHEITKSAIQKAIESPRKINPHLVDAQQARRVLDRLVGFELSPVLWKKVKPSLSAGRVQSVAVRVIVEREREIDDFTPTSSFKVAAEFLLKEGTILKAELDKKFGSEEEAKMFLQKCKEADYSIGDLQKRPGKKSPAAPFTTSTLQQEASRKLGYSVAQTMTLAQRLYESGKITYMRTDSVNLSDTALAAAKEEINKSFGGEYVNPRQYVTKAKGAQEAHEAIRPTYMNIHQAGDDDRQKKLYDLIWKRTIASQMSDAELERTTITIDVSSSERKFQAKGEVIKFDGFLKVYLESTDDENEDDKATEGILPPVTVGESLNRKLIIATQRFSYNPPRYTEASLVKRLEELGIGRPSTYAPTISTIQKRGYIIKEDRDGTDRNYQLLTLSNGDLKVETKTEVTGREKNKLFPTAIGLVVNDFLVEHFDKVMNYNFTASVEKEFDEIAQGEKKWNTVISQFYKPFHDKVEDTLENADRASGERELGVDPESGKKVIVRLGRYGPMVQIGNTDDEEGAKFASLLKSQTIEKLTFEEALELFKFPKTVGEHEGEEVVVAQGRFGPYVKFKEMFVSIPKGEDIGSVDLNRAIELIKEKQKADAPIDEYEGLPVQKGVGRFGPFIKWNNMFINVNKKYNFDNLSHEDIVELIEAKKKKEIEKYIHSWDDEGISVQKARWGRFNIVKGKTKIELPKTFDVEGLTLEKVKEIIEEKAPKKKAKRKPTKKSK